MKSPARLYFDRIRYYRKGMHQSLVAHLSGLYTASRKNAEHFPNDPRFAESKKILGKALKAEAAGRPGYARLLGLIGLKILSAATKRHAIGAFQ